MQELTVPTQQAAPARASLEAPRKQAGPLLHAVSVLGVYALFYAALFSPAWWAGKALAPGDAFNQTISAFVWGFDLWTPYLWSGFPHFADPQVMLWYPLRALFRLLQGNLALAFNLFVISAYLLAASGTYGYAYTLTRHRLAAFIAGLVFGTCGFMMAHLGHTNLVHAAAWLPWVMWGLEGIRRGGARWIGLTAVAVACGALAGHPQILVYSLGLAGAYVVVMHARRDIRQIAWRSVLLSFGAIASGLLLAGMQLLPTIELSRLSVRSTMDLAGFLTYSLPKWQAATLLFPFLFGGSPFPPFEPAYHGAWNLTEMSGYLGWTPWLLALAALLWGGLRDRVAVFWLAVAAVSGLLVVGDSTPLASVMFHLPGYNMFRAPARHFLELSFAAASLSGLAVATLAAARPSFHRAALFVAATVLGHASLMVLLPVVALKIPDGSGAGLVLAPMKNPAVGVPLAIGLVAIAAITALLDRGYGRWAGPVLAVITAADLCTFGLFCEWRAASGHLPDFAAAPRTLATTGLDGRIAPFDGVYSAAPDAKANASQLYGTVSASGYNPLVIRRYQELLGIDHDGMIPREVLRSENRALDILAAKRVVLNSTGTPGMNPGHPDHWQKLGTLGGADVFENRRALPTAWLAREVLSLSPDRIRTAITTSRLPDGRVFDPAAQALVEGDVPPGSPTQALAGQDAGTAEILAMRPGSWRLRVTAPGPRILVLSELAYPGWEARVDGVPSSVRQTNYVLKGLAVPGGTHEVDLTFAPPTFRQGILLTGAGLVLLLGLCFVLRFAARPRVEATAG